MWISNRIEYWIADDLQLHHILLSQLFLFSVCWKWLLNVISLDFYQIVSLLIMCTIVKCYIIYMTLLDLLLLSFRPIDFTSHNRDINQKEQQFV